jgi:hypothetical protein
MLQPKGKTLKKVLNNGKEPEPYIAPAIKDSIDYFHKKIDAISQGSYIPKSKGKQFDQYMQGLDRQYKKAGVKNPNRTVIKG